MIKQINWKNITPHAIAIGIFLVTAIMYCLPAFSNMMVNMHDVLGWKGMAQQSFEFKEKYGNFPLWTNSLFSGMPTYQVAFEGTNLINLTYFHYILMLGLPEPANIFFLSALCFYILTQSFSFKPWIGIIGAIAYSFASYNAILVAVGHTTKFLSMAYAPAVLAGLVLLTRKQYILGFLSLFLFSTLMVVMNHLQIVYYTFLICICFAIFFAIHALKNKEIAHLLKTGGLALVAGIIAACGYMTMLLPLNEYTKETMRGGRSELTASAKTANKTKGGLDKDYAFSWSYGIAETFTLLLPNYYGGASGSKELGENSKAVVAMQDANLPSDAINYFFNYLSSYWGEQPGTSGPVYLGVFICLFFIVGCFVVKDWHKGWIIAATVLGIILAWGKNLPSVNYFLFDYLPLYNKFRAPSMALVIPQLTIPLLAVWAMQQLFYGNATWASLKKQLRIPAIAVAIVVAALVIGYLSYSFSGTNDAQLKEGMAGALSQAYGNAPNAKEQATATAQSIIKGLGEDRKALYGADLFRVLCLLGIAIALLWLVATKKLKPQIAVIAIAAITFIDLITVDTRYLTKENYINKDEFIAPLQPNAADLQIKQDTSFFRVFDQSGGDPWSDSRPSYNHNSIGGYHPAKLHLYQDVIENQLSKGNMKVYNMLNAKYFIVADAQNRTPTVQQNPAAFGNAWLVKKIVFVPNANAEMKALDSIDKETVFIDEREKQKVSTAIAFDSLATINLVQNKNDNITYNFSSTTPQFAVFSEVYYPYGWKAYINGKEAAIVRCNYLLRGINVSAGKHTITFEFKPESVNKGNTISLVMGIFSYMLIGVCLVLLFKQYKQQKTA